MTVWYFKEHILIKNSCKQMSSWIVSNSLKTEQQLWEHRPFGLIFLLLSELRESQHNVFFFAFFFISVAATRQRRAFERPAFSAHQLTEWTDNCSTAEVGWSWVDRDIRRTHRSRCCRLRSQTWVSLPSEDCTASYASTTATQVSPRHSAAAAKQSILLTFRTRFRVAGGGVPRKY